MIVIRWLGQACFLITTLMGTRILIDPPHPQMDHSVSAHSLPANLVFVSNRLSGYDYVQAAAPLGGVKPSILQPLPLTKNNIVQSGTYRFGPRGAAVDQVHFTRISALAYNALRSQRSPDTITVISTGGLRLVQLGNIGQQALTAQQVHEIGRVDVLMLPVSGVSGIGGIDAAALVSQLHPRVILPMGYAPSLRSLALLSPFLSAMQGKASISHVASDRIKLSPQSLPRRPTIYLLR